MSGIESWSTTPANNNQSPPFGWPAGILPSQVEPIGRQMMTSLAAWYQAAEWINYNFTPTYVSATQFTLPGNVTPTFHVGRRVQATDGATSVYGTITVSAFTTLTTVTVVWDTGVLQTGVTIVYVSITSAVNTSAPNVTSSANPTASVGLTAVNGSATTYMRSDGAPALSQAITPTWTQVHTFSAKPVMNAGATVNAASGTALTVNGASGGVVGVLNSAAGQDLQIQLQTNGALRGYLGAATNVNGLINGSVVGDLIFRGENTVNLLFSADGGANAEFKILGTPALQGRGPVAAALVDMTPDKGSFTGTLTGMTAGTTGTVSWVRMGNVVLVYVAAAISGTSNTNAMTLTGLPAAIQPATTQIGQCPVTDSANGTIMGTFSITGGTVTLGRATLNVSVITYAQAFQTSGAKGLPAGWLISYSLA